MLQQNSYMEGGAVFVVTTLDLLHVKIILVIPRINVVPIG